MLAEIFLSFSTSLRVDPYFSCRRTCASPPAEAIYINVFLMHEPISIDIQKDSSSTIHQLDIQKYHADLLKRYSDYY